MLMASLSFVPAVVVRWPRAVYDQCDLWHFFFECNLNVERKGDQPRLSLNRSSSPIIHLESCPTGKCTFGRAVVVERASRIGAQSELPKPALARILYRESVRGCLGRAMRTVLCCVIINPTKQEMNVSCRCDARRKNPKPLKALFEL